MKTFCCTCTRYVDEGKYIVNRDREICSVFKKKFFCSITIFKLSHRVAASHKHTHTSKYKFISFFCSKSWFSSLDTRREIFHHTRPNPCPNNVHVGGVSYRIVRNRIFELQPVKKPMNLWVVYGRSSHVLWPTRFFNVEEIREAMVAKTRKHTNIDTLTHTY